MEAEVNSLHHQLQTEKTRFKKMESDLQRELQGAFDENTKLTTLLDGKVPKSMFHFISSCLSLSPLQCNNSELAFLMSPFSLRSHRQCCAGTDSCWPEERTRDTSRGRENPTSSAGWSKWTQGPPWWSGQFDKTGEDITRYRVENQTVGSQNLLIVFYPSLILPPSL